MKQFRIYRTAKSEICDYATFEAETLEEAIRMAEEDTEELQQADWKESHTDADGYTYDGEER